VKWTLFERLGERLSRFTKRSSAAPRGERGQRMPQEVAAEFTTEELAEFLEGDVHPNDARPEFREKLRSELWEMVQDLYGHKAGRD
jgi:hypothetical protein